MNLSFLKNNLGSLFFFRRKRKSKIHRSFANSLYCYYGIPKRDVLNHPEKYLGPNWEAVIDFWAHMDTLTQEQLLVVRDRYLALGEEGRHIAGNKVLYATNPGIKYAYPASVAAYSSVSFAQFVAYWSTCELIGLEKLLERGHQLVFFPLFLNL
jgi:hypothetical protein